MTCAEREARLRFTAQVALFFHRFLVQLMRLLERRIKLLLQVALQGRQLVGLCLHLPQLLNQIEDFDIFRRGGRHG